MSTNIILFPPLFPSLVNGLQHVACPEEYYVWMVITSRMIMIVCRREAIMLRTTKTPKQFADDDDRTCDIL